MSLRVPVFYRSSEELSKMRRRQTFKYRDRGKDFCNGPFRRQAFSFSGCGTWAFDWLIGNADFNRRWTECHRPGEPRTHSCPEHRRTERLRYIVGRDAFSAVQLLVFTAVLGKKDCR